MNSSALPLSIPLYEDPRKMKLSVLKDRLAMRGCSTQGNKTTLTARLIRAMVGDGLHNPVNPLLLHDQQPEKWNLVAHQLLKDAMSITTDMVAQEEALKHCDAVIGTVGARDLLIHIALGTTELASEPPLVRVMCRYRAAITLLETTRAEMEASCPDGVSMSSIGASIFISSLCGGFAAIPAELTEESATESLSQKRKRRKESIEELECIASDGTKIVVKIGAEVLVPIENENRVKCRVLRIEDGSSDRSDSGCGTSSLSSSSDSITGSITIYAKPLSEDFAGPFYVFKLSVDEFAEAVKCMDDIHQISPSSLH